MSHLVGQCVVDEGSKRSVDSITIAPGLGIQIAFANESLDFVHVYLDADTAHSPAAALTV